VNGIQRKVHGKTSRPCAVFVFCFERDPHARTGNFEFQKSNLLPSFRYTTVPAHYARFCLALRYASMNMSMSPFMTRSRFPISTFVR
jgi:hypothetical protein